MNGMNMKKYPFLCMILLVSVLMSCAEKKPGAEDAAVVETDSLRSADSVAGAENLDDELETQAGIYDVRDVERYWQKRTIQVVGDKNDIVGLFEAFNAVWPTKEGNSIVRATNPSLVQGDYYPGKPIIDRKHGFVESPYGEKNGKASAAVQACVWNRKNGHKLFAVHGGMYDDDIQDFAIFYDYDPAKKLLTPEESPLKKENQLFPDQRPVLYLLPQEGKSVYVREAGSIVFFEDVYSFDGQNLRFVGIDPGSTHDMQRMYEEEDLDDVHGKLAKFALIDIDGDGCEEIWTRTEDDEDGAIFGFEDEGCISFIIAESEGKRPSFGKGWVYVGFPAGGPSYFSQIVTVSDGHKTHTLTDFQVEEHHEYTLDGKDVSEAEGKKFHDSVKGEGKKLNPKWHKMVFMFDYQ